MLERYYIGDLDTDSSITAPSAKGRDDDSVKKYALDPKKKISFQLQSKTVLSHDSFILDFALQSKDTILGFPTGKHVFLSAVINGETVMRRYDVKLKMISSPVTTSMLQDDFFEAIHSGRILFCSSMP